MLICRAFQGLTAMGERIAANIYLTENLSGKYIYLSSCILALFSSVGSVLAVGLSVLVTSFGFNWRSGFLIGATVAQIGFIARRTLKESTEFVNAKNKLYTI